MNVRLSSSQEIKTVLSSPITHWSTKNKTRLGRSTTNSDVTLEPVTPELMIYLSVVLAVGNKLDKIDLSNQTNQ